MFTVTDKKILGFVVVVLIIILLTGFAVFKYITEKPRVDIINVTGGAQTQESPEINSPNPSVSAKPEASIQYVPAEIDEEETLGKNGDNGFSVCANKCGDGICQKNDPDCDSANNLNCACPETSQECPQDCD